MSDSILPSGEGPKPPKPVRLPRDVRNVKQVGEYKVEGILGRGGMGIVYKGRHPTLDVVRALKVMTRPDHPKGLARFRREATNLARVRHPNVVQIHDFGETDDDSLFFAMELVHGEPLNAVLARDRLPLRQALDVAMGVGKGLAALHEAGVIHRDLKPGNVVLAEEGRPVVLDLGLAVNPERDTRLTKTGATLGTLTYMAPELFHDAKAATPQTDIYALGLLLFELTAGCPVVDHALDPHEVAVQVLEGKTPLPSGVDAGLPVALDAICARALAKDPAARWPSAEAMVAALAAVRANPGRTRRQHRRLVFAVCLAIAAVVGLLTLALWPVAAPPTGR